MKAETSKKRGAPESSIKTPVQDKKAKVTPQKTGNSPVHARPYGYIAFVLVNLFLDTNICSYD